MEKRKFVSLKLVVAGMVAAFGISSCTTTYDAYGRPVQSVDPGAVAVGAVALGAIAYAAGKNNGDKKKVYKYRGYDRGYYGHSGYRGHYGHRGYYGGHRGCR